jgi:hypothetical protein
MIGSMMPQQQMGFGMNQQPMQPFAPNPFKWYSWYCDGRIAIEIASVKQLGPLRIFSALTAVVSPTAFVFAQITCRPRVLKDKGCQEFCRPRRSTRRIRPIRDATSHGLWLM